MDNKTFLIHIYYFNSHLKDRTDESRLLNARNVLLYVMKVTHARINIACHPANIEQKAHD